MLRQVLYGIGAVVISIVCFPLLPWYLLLTVRDLWNRHDQEVTFNNAWKVLQDNPDYLRAVMRGTTRINKN